MKKSSPALKARQRTLARIRARRRKRRRLSSEERELLRRVAVAQQKAEATALGVRPPSDWYRELIVLPRVLSLRTNYDATVRAIIQLRDAVLLRNRPVQLYFDHVEEIEPAATLLLAAEAFRCRHLRAYRGGQMIIGTYPRSSDVFLQLREMGFYKVMEAYQLDDEFPDTRDRAGRPYFLRFVSLKLVAPEPAAAIVDLIARTSVDMSARSKRRLVGALKEAMGNAVEHAYTEETAYQAMSDRYWIAGYVHPDTREAMLMLLDQGAGIPNTLGPTRFEQISSLLRFSWQPTDGHMIAAATELHRTSTGRRSRGKGFRDMKRFINSCDDGELRVLSNRGCYRYMKSGYEVSDETLSIGGTLVEWRVRHEQTVEIEARSDGDLSDEGLQPTSWATV